MTGDGTIIGVDLSDDHDYTVGGLFNIQPNPAIPPNTFLIHQGNTPAPAYTFNSDSTTGMFRVGDVTIRRTVLVRDLSNGKHSTGTWVEESGFRVVVNGMAAGDVAYGDDSKLETTKEKKDFYKLDGMYSMKKGKEEKLFTVQSITTYAKSGRVRIATREISNLEAIERQSNLNG